MTNIRYAFLVVMLVRKQCENPTDYFDKTFAEYQEGFSANGEFQQKDDKMTKHIFPGEVWIGLDKLHQLTSARSYSLKITMTDYDGKKYTALFEQFQVNSFSYLFARFL